MEESFEERQKRENQENYKKWLACGFTGEMPMNESGWFVPVIRLYHKTETISVFDKYPYRASIEIFHLPNGKWVATSDLMCPTYGYGSACSVSSKQHETKEDAMQYELSVIENSLEEKDRKQFVVNAIQTCRNKYKKEMLETAFEPTAQFEQVTLF